MFWSVPLTDTQDSSLQGNSIVRNPPLCAILSSNMDLRLVCGTQSTTNCYDPSDDDNEDPDRDPNAGQTTGDIKRSLSNITDEPGTYFDLHKRDG